MKQLYEFLINNKSTGIIKVNNVDEFVDLELSTNMLWSTRNLGAKNEFEYGNLYMWGKVTRNNDDPCDDTCIDFRNVGLMINYANVLFPKYDAVSTLYKSNKFHMPTKHDAEILLKETTQECVNNYKDSGVNGYVFTSKKNDKSIFFPASAYRIDNETQEPEQITDNISFIWTSSIDGRDYRYAWCLFFASNRSEIAFTNCRRIYMGLPIRAIKKK